MYQSTILGTPIFLRRLCPVNVQVRGRFWIRHVGRSHQHALICVRFSCPINTAQNVVRRLYTPHSHTSSILDMCSATTLPWTSIQVLPQCDTAHVTAPTGLSSMAAMEPCFSPPLLRLLIRHPKNKPSHFIRCTSCFLFAPTLAECLLSSANPRQVPSEQRTTDSERAACCARPREKGSRADSLRSARSPSTR